MKSAKPNHWKRAHYARESFIEDRDQLFILGSQREFYEGMLRYGMTQEQAVAEWLRMDAGEPGKTRRYWLKHGHLPSYTGERRFE